MKYDESYIWNNTLTRWTEQGVMLLNTVLTVDAKVSNSHKGKGWEEFTLKTVKALDKKDVIFLLWGKSALEYYHDIKKAKVLIAEHPVAASYQGRIWEHGECFQKVNELLKYKIVW